jgi:hypothetical protein
MGFHEVHDKRFSILAAYVRNKSSLAATCTQRFRLPSAHRMLTQRRLDRVHDVTGRNAELLDQLLRFSAGWNLPHASL